MSENVRKCPILKKRIWLKQWPPQAMRIFSGNGSDIRRRGGFVLIRRRHRETKSPGTFRSRGFAIVTELSASKPLLDEQHLAVRRQRPEVVGDHRLQLVGGRAHVVERGEHVFA